MWGLMRGEVLEEMEGVWGVVEVRKGEFVEMGLGEVVEKGKGRLDRVDGVGEG